MRYLRIIGATLLALVAVGASGCGGDDEPSIEEIVSQISSTTTTTTETATRDGVIAAADAVCAEANAAIASLTESTDPAIAADQVRSITDGLRRDLREIALPAEGESDFNALLAALRAQVKALEQRAATSRAADDAGYQAAGVDLESARADAQAAADAYGFEDCGQPFDEIEADPGAGGDDGADSGGVAPEIPATPTTPTTPVTPPGGGTGAPDGGTGGDTGGDTGSGGDSGSGGISPG